MTVPVENKKRRDRGWLSFKTCFSEAEVKDVLVEMCNVFMLTGLDWISDRQKVITDRHGVVVVIQKKICMTSSCCRSLCRIVSPVQTVSSSLEIQDWLQMSAILIRDSSVMKIQFLCFYHLSIKRNLNRRLICECRCDERLKTKGEGTTRLA